MATDYYITSRALTAKLVGCEKCGPTSHDNCETNLDWCKAEVKAQNKKHGREVYAVRYGAAGTVWVGLTDRAPANWSNESGDANE